MDLDIGYIYGLCEPNGTIRYIGLTKRTVEVRLAEHLVNSKTLDYPVYRWVRKLAEKGENPSVRLLESATLAELNDCEVKWVALYRTTGQLLNCTDGGYGVRDSSGTLGVKLRAIHNSPEVKNNHRKARLASLADPKVYADQVARLRDLSASPEIRAKIGAGVKAYRTLPGIKEKVSAKQKLAYTNPEVKAKISAKQVAAWNKPGARAERAALARQTQNRPEVKKKCSGPNSVHWKRTPERITLVREYADLYPNLSKKEIARRLKSAEIGERLVYTALKDRPSRRPK